MSRGAFDLSAWSVSGRRDGAVIERPRLSQDDYVLWDGVLPLRTAPASPRSSFSGRSGPLKGQQSAWKTLHDRLRPDEAQSHLPPQSPPHPPALLHTFTMSTAAQGVLQITSYDTTVWNTESTGTQFSILIHFTYLVQFRQSHCSFFPFYMMAACFHEDTIPVCDGRTGLVCTERQSQLYQTRQLIAEQRHQTSSTGCMEANPRWRRKKARVQSPPRQSINQSNTLLIPDGTIHSKQGQQDIKQLTHRQQTDEANLHWRHSDIEAAALLGTLFHSFITAEKNPRMFYGNM